MAIKLICIVGFIGALITVPTIWELALRMGGWYPIYLTACALVGFVSMIGLWMMRKWAVYAYTALAVINQAVALHLGAWNIFSLAIPGAVIAVMFLYVSRMR